MWHWILYWVLNALSLMIVAWIVPGVYVRGFGMALIGVLVIALVNATVGVFMKVLTLPLSILTLGLFLLVINALMLKLAAAIVPGFSVQGFLPAFAGAILLSLVNVGLRHVVFAETLL